MKMIRLLLILEFLFIAPTAAFAAAYQLTSGAAVVRESDTALIPADPLNADWQAYQRWLAAGNTPDPIPAPSAAAQAQATYNTALANGLTATCASGATVCTSAIVATYSLDPTQVMNLANVSLYIAVNGKFPGGQTTLALISANKSLVLVPSIAAWQEIATVVADYVTKLTVALQTVQAGGTPTWPSATVTLN